MTNKLQNQPELVQRELKAFADRVQEILTVGLISIDGLILGLYDKRYSVTIGEESYAENAISAMSAAMVSMGERISMELRAGEWEFSVIGGKQGIVISLMVDPELVISVIAKHGSSVDAILPELKAACERLNAL